MYVRESESIQKYVFFFYFVALAILLIVDAATCGLVD